jgi:hypothetical protein
MSAATYYNILEVQPTASLQEIKTAFRRLALMYHPDRNPGTEAASKFNELHKAYQVLGDHDRRRAYDMQLNMGIPPEEAGQPVVFITDRIWMKVSRRRIRPGESFSVVIRSFKRANEPVLQGLHQFEVINHYSQVIMIQDRPLREVLYVLKCKEEGTFRLGPASLKQGKYDYISGYYDIVVSTETVNSTRKEVGKIAYAVLGAFAFFLVFNVLYYTFVASKEEHNKQAVSIYAGRDKEALSSPAHFRQLPTGSAPYEDVLGKNVFAKTYNEVRLKNGKDFDVVVCLYDAKSGKTVRHHYIRASEDYTIDAVPDGEYFLKVIFGKDWDPVKPMKELGTMGGFKYDLSYEVFSDEKLRMKMKKKKGDKWSSNIYEFTLYPIDSGNAHAETVEGEKFFNKK